MWWLVRRGSWWRGGEELCRWGWRWHNTTASITIVFSPHSRIQSSTVTTFCDGSGATDIQLYLPPVRVMTGGDALSPPLWSFFWTWHNKNIYNNNGDIYDGDGNVEEMNTMLKIYDGRDSGDIDLDDSGNTVNAMRLPFRTCIMLSSLLSFPVYPPPFIAVSNTVLCRLNHCSPTSYELRLLFNGISATIFCYDLHPFLLF